MKVIKSGGGNAERRFTIVLETGEKASASVCDFAVRERLTGHFVAVGAVQRCTFAFWNPQTRKYENIDVDEQMEVIALTGNVAIANGKPKVHAHIVLGGADGRARGGHLVEAEVRPTLEIQFLESAETLKRTKDPETGLDLLVMGGR
jgi:predicted DNA-binding protein with PD1-like motif